MAAEKNTLRFSLLWGERGVTQVFCRFRRIRSNTEVHNFHLEDSGSSGDLPLDRAAMNTRVSLKRVDDRRCSRFDG